MKKIKKGDEVIVISGKDKGRKGIVLEVHDQGEKLLVEGVNIAKKHTRANPNTGDKGGIVIKTRALHRSKIMLYDQASGKGSRVGIKLLKDGRKERYFKNTDELVDV